jgi:hypothetical protein
MSPQAQVSIPVRFSSKVAWTLECDAPGGTIQFTLDIGSNGNKSICLEHHPRGWARSADYSAAFAAARQYLVSCGYEVEVYGS